MAAEATAQAVLRAIRAAEPLRINGLWLPASARPHTAGRWRVKRERRGVVSPC